MVRKKSENIEKMCFLMLYESKGFIVYKIPTRERESECLRAREFFSISINNIFTSLVLSSSAAIESLSFSVRAVTTIHRPSLPKIIVVVRAHGSARRRFLLVPLFNPKHHPIICASTARRTYCNRNDSIFGSFGRRERNRIVTRPPRFTEIQQHVRIIFLSVEPR